jgi:hypothetical protein
VIAEVLPRQKAGKIAELHALPIAAGVFDPALTWCSRPRSPPCPCPAPASWSPSTHCCANDFGCPARSLRPRDRASCGPASRMSGRPAKYRVENGNISNAALTGVSSSTTTTRTASSSSSETARPLSGGSVRSGALGHEPFSHHRPTGRNARSSSAPPGPGAASKRATTRPPSRRGIGASGAQSIGRSTSACSCVI